MDNLKEEFAGHLFSSIGYKSEKDVRNLIDNLNLEQSLVFINKALEYSYSQGVFSMIEAEIISKSLSILNSQIVTKEINQH